LKRIDFHFTPNWQPKYNQSGGETEKKAIKTVEECFSFSEKSFLVMQSIKLRGKISPFRVINYPNIDIQTDDFATHRSESENLQF
jgi:hypothetical protein